MNFIAENYVWFIVIGVVILMAVIGYIADKTDFGRQKNNGKSIEKKPKKVKEVKEKKPIKVEVDAKGINDLNQDVIKNTSNDDYIPVENNNQNIVEQSTISNENIDQSLFTPLEETNNTVASNSVSEVIDDEKKVEPELQTINPTTLPDNNQPVQNVTEEEDIWKF